MRDKKCKIIIHIFLLFALAYFFFAISLVTLHCIVHIKTFSFIIFLSLFAVNIISWHIFYVYINVEKIIDIVPPFSISYHIVENIEFKSCKTYIFSLSLNILLSSFLAPFVENCSRNARYKKSIIFCFIDETFEIAF